MVTFLNSALLFGVLCFLCACDPNSKSSQENALKKIQRLSWQDGTCYMTHPYQQTGTKGVEALAERIEKLRAEKAKPFANSTADLNAQLQRLDQEIEKLQKSMETDLATADRLIGLRYERRLVENDLKLIDSIVDREVGLAPPLNPTATELVGIYEQSLKMDVAKGLISEEEAEEYKQRVIRAGVSMHDPKYGAWPRWEPGKGKSGVIGGNWDQYPARYSKHRVSVRALVHKQADGFEHFSLMDQLRSEQNPNGHELVSLRFRKDLGLEMWALTGGRFRKLEESFGQVSLHKKFDASPAVIQIQDPALVFGFNDNPTSNKPFSLLRLFDENGEVKREVRSDGSVKGVKELARTVYLHQYMLPQFHNFSGVGSSIREGLLKNETESYRFTDYTDEDARSHPEIFQTRGTTTVLLTKHPVTALKSDWILTVERKFQAPTYSFGLEDDADGRLFTCYLIAHE